MFSTAKAQALLRDLNDRLNSRLANSSTLNQSASYFSVIPDAAGALWPYLLVTLNGAAAEGNSVIYIRIQGLPLISTDIFNNPSDSYSPHEMLFAYELASSGAPIPIASDLATVQYEAQKCGTEFALVQLPHGTAVTDANVIAATPVVVLDDLYWPTKSI